MVDYSSLENYRTERYRGFESLSLRFLIKKPAENQRVLLFSKVEVPFEVPLLFYISLTVVRITFLKLQCSGDIFLLFYRLEFFKHININKSTLL